MIIYGCEIPPYHLPVFMPMIIFSLEFIRQRLNACQLHFVLAKKGYIFKLSRPVRPFAINSRHAFNGVEALLKEMNFELGDVWNYDPHGVISQRREKIKASTYIHEHRPKIEWRAIEERNKKVRDEM